MPLVFTSAKSRTRRNNRLAILGVPRERLAISCAPPDSISIGLGAIEDGEIAFEFYVRSPADAKKFYARLLGPIKKEN